MTRIGLHLRPRKDLEPLLRIARALDRGGVRIVSLEMRGVDLDAPDRRLCGQLDDDPIVPRAAPPPRFPTVAHVAASPRHDQVVPGAEKHVAAGEDFAAVLDRGEIELAEQSTFAMPIRNDFTVHAKSRHSAVRKNMK